MARPRGRSSTPWPVLGDLLAAVREPAVQGLVGDTGYGAGGETVTQAFIRILTALSGDWPIMFAPTAFDVGHVRIAAIDLAGRGAPGLARGGGARTAAFYLLARHALTRHWWIGEDSLADIPEPYRGLARAPPARYSRGAQAARVSTSSTARAGAPAVRAQVERDVREARKLRVRPLPGIAAAGGFRRRAGPSLPTGTGSSVRAARPVKSRRCPGYSH